MAFSWTENQKKIIKHRSGNLLVAAGAGSGKTAVLVEHIIDRVLDETNPVDIDEMLVLTYTKAAAAEMKDRVRKGLEDRLMTDHDEKQDNNIRRQLSLLNTARISTIDSFCQQVLREQFFKVDLDPGFKVADETEIELLKNDILDSIFERKYEEKDEEFLSLADKYGKVKGDDNLKSIIKHVLAQAVKFPEPESWLDSQLNRIDISWHEEVIRDNLVLLKAYIQQYKSLETFARADFFPNELIEVLKKDNDCLAKILEQPITNIEEFNAALGKIKFGTKKGKPKNCTDPAWDNPNISELFDNWRNTMKKKLQEMQKLFAQFTVENLMYEEERLSETVFPLIRLTKQYFKEFSASKAAENQVDFYDMERLVWKLFVKPENEYSDTALEYAGRFKEILVDEYQDCNQIQEDILTAISDKNVPNRFMVGDVKQSIYGFRGGNSKIFLDKYNDYRANADSYNEVVELRENFRSSVGVLEGINKLFSMMMTRENSGIDYENDAYLKPDEKKLGAEKPDIEICLMNSDSSEEGKKAQEAMMVADKIHRMISDGVQVIDKDTGELRTACYGDVAILLRSTSTNASYYLDALKARGISAYSESEKGYYDSTEIVDVLSFLNILDNPYQDVELIGVLRSGFVSLTADELAQIKLSAGKEAKWFYDAMLKAHCEELGETKNKIDAFFKMYNYFRERAAILPLSELIGEILDSTGYIFYAAALPNGKKRVQNLNMLRVKARDFEKTRYRGIFRFLKYIEQLKSYEMDIATPSLVDNSDSVVIMTIHKSKGLEFPICFVCGMAGSFSTLDYSGKLLYEENYGLGAEIIDTEFKYRYKSYKRQCIAEKKKKNQKTEELRLLYVAMTRARDKLIMTATYDKLKEKLSGFRNSVDENMNTLSEGNLLDGKCYMDWVMMAFCLEEKRQGFINSIASDGKNISTISLEKTEIQAEIIDKVNAEEADSEPEVILTATTPISDRLKDIIDRRYKYEKTVGIHTMYTVTELKKASNNHDNDDVAPMALAKSSYKKDKSEEKITGNIRGTLYHLCAEKLSFAEMENLKGDELKEEVNKQLYAMLLKGIISEKEREAVDTQDFCSLIDSELGNRICQADKKGLFLREQKFLLSEKPEDIAELHIEGSTDEKVMIKGIIDVVFKEDDHWIIVDYKTDKVSGKYAEKNLVDRYHVQLEYYKKAWEDICGEKVTEMYLYSFALARFIKL